LRFGFDTSMHLQQLFYTSFLFKPRKILISNFYKPIKINIKFLTTINYYLKIIKYRIISLINKYNLFKLK